MLDIRFMLDIRAHFLTQHHHLQHDFENWKTVQRIFKFGLEIKYHIPSSVNH